ncbi:MAG: hypothetical protein L0332_02680 [Chloroflexi bacterium]|nr:hypothetical protein [Chloroflexota bacterium]MCI0576015.1 hypothetical protein [Chloroflexota bacterium]MCI0645139.1 hypothetical protein [Chloroflexota bacterium]MCI0725619.1 hypothetical protein [Chloroflexota bacterium]
MNAISETAEHPVSPGMGDMDMADSRSTQQYAPLVQGFYEGGEVWFIHTEASDPEVATMLTEMMGGPQVVLVPALADAPGALLANVYVFTNGVEGAGPFGFQPDVFDAVPGDEAYRPLRTINLVAWNEAARPRELRSVAEIREAETNGEVAITQPGIVVNMPILVWPGGSRQAPAGTMDVIP